jgi:hypothetical protein
MTTETVERRKAKMEEMFLIINPNVISILLG